MASLTRTLAAGALGATLLLGTVACGDDAGDKAAEELIEKNVGGDVDINSDAGTVDITTPDGSMSSGRNELPDGWPDDVPFPEDYEIVFHAENGDEENGVTINVVANTDDPAQDVIAAFRDTIDDSWKVVDEIDMSGGGSDSLSIGYEKDGRTLTIAAIGGADTPTQISVSHITAT